MILSHLTSRGPQIIVLYNDVTQDKVLLEKIWQHNMIFQEVLLCYMILSWNHFSQCMVVVVVICICVITYIRLLTGLVSYFMTKNQHNLI